jgi:hypothetical protein
MRLGKNSYEFGECRARKRDGARCERTELSKEYGVPENEQSEFWEKIVSD